MRLSIVSFTENGRQLSERIAEKLDGIIETELFTKCKTDRSDKNQMSVLYLDLSVGEWAKVQMQDKNAMLFIGACGIAVRAVAPYLTDKLHDSPVLVMDERGEFVIPVLSGHMGGANELALCLSEKTGAQPVITTATDLNGKFAVDLFAKRNGLYIVNKDGIAKVSSKALAGKEILIAIEPGHVKNVRETDGQSAESSRMERNMQLTDCSLREKTALPEGVRMVSYPPDGPVDVVVTAREEVFDTLLLLRPREYVIGMGCKKGKKAVEIEDFIKRELNKYDICVTQIFALASISQKQKEPGMTAWSQKTGVPFLTYTALELQEVEGKFNKSTFVKEQVGVDNVCERAALKACGPGGKLLYEKHAENGMTIAIAKREWKAGFYEK